MCVIAVGPARAAAPAGVTDVSVTVHTNPDGRSFAVDDTTYTSMQMFTWTTGSVHTLSTWSPQGGGGTHYVWSDWSDGGAMSLGITASGNQTHTASFDLQCLLAMSNGEGGGTVTPPSAWCDSADVVEIHATADSGYRFDRWTGTGTGSYMGPDSVATIVMGSGVTETAVFRSLLGVAATRLVVLS